LPNSLPKVARLLGDRGYIAALTPTGSETRCKTKGDVPASPCIPSWKQREKPVGKPSDATNAATRIEIVFGQAERLAARGGPRWPMATRDDLCPKGVFSASALAATVIYWL